MIDKKLWENYIDNSDNEELLNTIKELVNVIVNDIEYMNDLEEEPYELDFGNNKTIKAEDLETLVSILDIEVE